MGTAQNDLVMATKADGLSSIVAQDDVKQDEFDNVPPTFRGQPDSNYFSLTEQPQVDRK